RKDLQTIENCLPYIDNIQSIEKEIRAIAHDLNQDVFSNTDSFKTVVVALFVEQKNISKINCHLEIDRDINWDLIESTKKIHLYRILQEALQNINKHSQAKNIIVSILNRNNTLLFEIYDDGIGFNIKNKKTGIGIQNIRSRVKDCDGTIDIRSENGAGTTIMISVLPS
ncbi:MAG TPA: ATP-binding protein, partial [Flavobacterium sp.]|nr:ATP-binding protein [Flavobacterium sp.]